MAKPTDPLWRHAFDALEKPLRDRAEALAGTEEFSRALMAAFGVLTAARRGVRAASTKTLHLANLPAHADLRRLSRQLGTLENKVDKLASDLERVVRLLDDRERPRGKRSIS